MPSNVRKYRTRKTTVDQIARSKTFGTYFYCAARHITEKDQPERKLRLCLGHVWTQTRNTAAEAAGASVPDHRRRKQRIANEQGRGAAEIPKSLAPEGIAGPGNRSDHLTRFLAKRK